MLTELFITSRADWRNDARCRDADPEDFFPVASATFNKDGVHNKTFVDQAQRALRMCRRCPVVTDCLQVALADPRPDKDTWAVVGGTLPGQRAMLRKEMAAARAKEEAEQAAEAEQEPAFAA